MTGDSSPALARAAGTAGTSRLPVCAACGTTAPGPAPISWSAGMEDGRRVWTCDACAREHLRSIEGKLDSAWW
jgi:hypothetical protein